MAKYTSLRELRKAINEYAGKAEQEFVKKLAKLGYDAIMYAYRNRGFKHKTYNLHDSYGSAVYYDGKLIESSIRYAQAELSKKPDKLTLQTGRQALNEFLRSRRYGRARHEFVLVCVAAMYYTQYLEKGKHRGAYRIQVISAAHDYVDNNFDKYLNTKQKVVVLKGVRPISNESEGLL